MGKKDFNLQEFKAFVEEFHPRTLMEYQRYTRRLDLPKYGEALVMLRSGFSGGPGVTRYVVGYHLRSTGTTEKDYDDINDVSYIAVRESMNKEVKCNTSCLMPDTWWKDAHIIDEKECVNDNKCIRRSKNLCCYTCALFISRECSIRCTKTKPCHD